MVVYNWYETDNRVMRYAEALVSRGDSVDVIAVRLPGQAPFVRYRGVDLYRIQTRLADESSGRLNYLFRLTRFLLKSSWIVTKLHLHHPYSVVHVHSVPDFEVFSTLVPKIFGAKVILDIHDLVPELFASKFRASRRSMIFRALVVVERLSIRFSDHVIIANHLWYDRLVKRSVPVSKCTTVLNYPDPRIFYPRVRTRTDGAFVYMYPGAISYRQGVDIAVRAFGRIRGSTPDARLWIYGDGPARHQIEDLIRELRLTDHVFVFDSVPLTRVAEIMAEADVAVEPKRNDSFGDEAFSTKSLEFMAVGIPLIISATKIHRYYFNNVQVRFFRPGDDEDLANQMRLLYEDRSVRTRLVQAATAFVSELSWERRKSEYLRLVDNLSTTARGRCARSGDRPIGTPIIPRRN
jgi:glycosyltransferase involved in cell wall biosynthesis